MKYIAPFLVGFSLLFAGFAHGDEPAAVYKLTVTAYKDGKVEDVLSYHAKSFDSLADCQAFLEKPDPEFVLNTVKLLKTLTDRGDDKATLSCEPQKQKPSI